MRLEVNVAPPPELGANQPQELSSIVAGKFLREMAEALRQAAAPDASLAPKEPHVAGGSFLAIQRATADAGAVADSAIAALGAAATGPVRDELSRAAIGVRADSTAALARENPLKDLASGPAATPERSSTITHTPPRAFRSLGPTEEAFQKLFAAVVEELQNSFGAKFGEHRLEPRTPKLA